LSISLFFFRTPPYNDFVLGGDKYKERGVFLNMEEAETKKKQHCYTCYIDGEAFLCCDGDECMKPKRRKRNCKKKEN
jgi:hypothetical protein